MQYQVHWNKTYYASGVVTIEAESPEQAEQIAWDNLGDYEGSMQYDPEGDLVEAMGDE